MVIHQLNKSPSMMIDPREFFEKKFYFYDDNTNSYYCMFTSLPPEVIHSFNLKSIKFLRQQEK